MAKHFFFNQKSCTNNSPDSFLNGFTRLTELTVSGSSYFFKVSSTPDFDNKILSTAESGFEAQNLLKFCPEYCTKEREFIKVQQILQIDVLSLITQQLSLHQTW